MSTAAEWNAFFRNTASEYERQVASVTRKIATQILTLLPPITPSSIIHDNACGPGIVTLDILSQATASNMPPPTIYATDFAEAMVVQLQDAIDAQNLKTVTAQVMDGSDLSAFGDNTFTHSITSFGIFAFPDAVAGTKHIFRTLKPGGVAIITTWKYPGKLHFVNEVLQDLAPGSTPFWPFQGWLEEEKLRGVLEEGGFEKGNIEIHVKETIQDITDLEMTLQLYDSPYWNDVKAQLDEEQKGRWKDVVRKKLEERKGKGIAMVAWVGVGKK